MCVHMFACVEFSDESAIRINENHCYEKSGVGISVVTNVRRNIKMSDERPHSRLTFCQTSPRSFSATLYLGSNLELTQKSPPHMCTTPVVHLMFKGLGIFSIFDKLEGPLANVLMGTYIVHIKE